MVTAIGKKGEHEIKATVINPGGWWGKTFLIEVPIGNFPAFFVVEQDNLQEALAEFADSKYGFHVKIPEADYHEHGAQVRPGDKYGETTYTTEGWVDLHGKFSNNKLLDVVILGDHPCSLDNVCAEEWKCVYFDKDDPDCRNIPAELYENRRSRYVVFCDETDHEILCCRTEKDAQDWCNKHEGHDYEEIEIDHAEVDDGGEG